MKLLRKINNNAAVAQDKRGREMVVLGRGVGFHPMPYELTDLSVVYRTFYDVDPQYYEMLSSLPEEALMAAADIAEQAEIALQAELNPNLPFTLADHIAFAQERENKASVWPRRCTTMCSISTRGNTSWGCRLWKRCACAPAPRCPAPRR